jgi:glutathione S-transferase/RNA polymerase-associated protein
MKAAVGNFSKGTFKRQYRDHRLEFLIRAGGLEIVAEGLKKDNIRFTDPREFVRVGGNLVKGGKAWVEMAKL